MSRAPSLDHHVRQLVRGVGVLTVTSAPTAAYDSDAWDRDAEQAMGWYGWFR